MQPLIAIVEDEPALLENYADALRRHGYRVIGFESRASALAQLNRNLPDLAILDVGLAGDPEGGFEICRELRALSASLPIVFLTARDADVDVVSGLRLGADDYISKDVSMPHLLARVAALFRRAEAMAEERLGQQLAVDFLVLDTDRLAAEWRGAGVKLTLTEFWIVHALARFPGHVKSRGQLMQEASVVVDEATVSSHIKRIRRKFEAIDPEFDRIEAMYAAGYRWRSEPPA